MSSRARVRVLLQIQTDTGWLLLRTMWRATKTTRRVWVEQTLDGGKTWEHYGDVYRVTADRFGHVRIQTYPYPVGWDSAGLTADTARHMAMDIAQIADVSEALHAARTRKRKP